MRLLDLLLGRQKTGDQRGHGDPTGVHAKETPAKLRTPDEAKARRKAYRRRKAAKAARKRNRR